MRSLLVAVLVMISTPVFAAGEAGCFEQDATGNRFTLTDDPATWTYKPIEGATRTCTYTMDADLNPPARVIGCEGGWRSTVINDGHKHVTMFGRRWAYGCPLDLGL